MSILSDIKEYKLKEIARTKELIPVKLLEESIYFEGPCLSLRSYLTREDLLGIIAEFKRKSPSKGQFHKNILVEDVTVGYMQGGASALSILTDGHFFGGGVDDLKVARKFNLCPILRKDFMLDEYQVLEAKSWGADVILLIAKMISVEQCQALANFAHSLGMETLLEIHSAEEFVSHMNEAIDIVGINNRNLDDFTVDWKRSLEIKSKLPHEIALISESGISDPEVLLELKQAGFSGFLMGEAFMRQSEPQKACHDFVNRCLKLKK